MKHTLITTTALTLGLVSLPFASALADATPPVNAKPLSAILTALEQQNIGKIAEAEFEHGRWEVTVCQPTACQKLDIDPITGTTKRQRNTDMEKTPGDGATPISTLVKQLEAAKTGVVTGIDFERDHWTVELAVAP